MTTNQNKDQNKTRDSEHLEFQVLDYNNYHEVDGDDEDVYVIQMFGRTEDDKDVCLKVRGFTPHFYVKIPTHWESCQVNKFIYALKKKVSYSSSKRADRNFDSSKCLKAFSVVSKYDYHNFVNKQAYKFVRLVFKNYTAFKDFSNALSRPMYVDGLHKGPMLYQRYESNIEPNIRFIHINNLPSCGWIKVNKSKALHLPKYSDCDHSYEVHWKDVKPSDNDNRMAPLKMAAYDIECISCDANFPQANRITDKIIQIGITLYRYGSMICYEQHMLTLKDCDTINGVHLECFAKEKNLIRAWARKIKELRPDTIAGYNNFGFDDKYIFDRILRIDKETADKKKIPVKLLKKKFIDEILEILGKVNNRYIMESERVEKSLSTYEIKKLSSSALGDNELRFFKIPGIVSVDMMKIIQKDHQLISYKLDNVSANFITEKITNISDLGNGKREDKKIMTIYTNSTKALEKDSYVQIMVDDGYASAPLHEGAKYRVLSIKTETIEIMGKDQVKQMGTAQAIQISIIAKEYEEIVGAMNNKLLKVFWTFAKDDMHHTYINKYFGEGNPKKIKQVAKYCLKDCKLVNLLMAKLQIIVNNMGMAKVCHVPLSYLFLRGQGVKIFSLVSKKCKDRGFLIPVIQKKDKDLDGDDDETYEGATVITPKPGIYLSPIGVLDFSSLYPNSMRERNLSPECYVKDSKYGNMPGYIYHDIYITLKDNKGKIIRNIDGTAKKELHRFAQEIVTEEQVGAEMKGIIDRINVGAAKVIAHIEEQQYLTFSDRRNIFNYDIKGLEAIIGQIKCDTNVSEDTRVKLIEEQRQSIEKLTLTFKAYEKIHVKLTKKLAIHSNDDDSATAINLNNGEVTKVMLKKLIAIERAKATLKINIERDKRYNIAKGKLVKYGILPEILAELLGCRKEINAALAQEEDEFVRAILNSLQIAYKVTANSLYGQTGAPTSAIFFMQIAASTTATGRERLHFAKKIVETHFVGAEVIYGDTDSIFINFHIKDENGIELTCERALAETIKKCCEAAKIINSLVPKPQSIVYEKTFHPYILVAKKKYVGLLFTDNTKQYYLKSMGIVLKRRDNSPIVKIVVGGIINYILINRDIQKALAYAKEVIEGVMSGGYTMDRFVISKTLRSNYVRPKSIAHKVLADRMAIRDPGNKPQVNDRIPYVYVVRKFPGRDAKTILQGELIDTPEFVVKNGLKLDYLHYLQKQIMKPASQILELIMPEKKVKQFFNQFIIKEMCKRKNLQSIDKWMGGNKGAATTTAIVPTDDYNNLISGCKKRDTSGIIHVGNTKKIECQNINKWIQPKKR